MAVQLGEGTTDIIYGEASIPAGPLTYGGYIARPDGLGEWPTVIVVGPDPEPTSTAKDLCRVLARHGIAAVAPSLSDSTNHNHRINTAIAGFVSDPTGQWSNAQFGFGVLALEAGIADASVFAAQDGRVLAWAAVGSAIDAVSADNLALGDAAGLFIGSRSDDAVDIDEALGFRDILVRTTFVVYPDGDTGFWNDDSPGYNLDRYEDTRDRVIAFFGKQLPPRV
ncbi:MAG: dienelactone hydrolase family protein [Acidimicrobiia bacterium]